MYGTAFAVLHLAAWCLAVPACAQRKLDTEASDVTAATSSSSGSDVQTKDKGLSASIDGKSWRFADAVEGDAQRREDFVRLARVATAPHELAAALSALTRLEAQRTSPAAVTTSAGDAELDELVTRSLVSSHPRVVGRTLELATSLLRASDTHQALTDALLAHAQSPRFELGPMRRALLGALREAKPKLRSSAWYGTFLEALAAADNYVVALATEALLAALPGLQDRSQLRAFGSVLLDSEDPLLRGKGLEIVGAIERDASDAVREIYNLLDDPNPYVRSKACFALARMKHRAAIHVLVPLLDDTTANVLRYEIPQLEGPALTETLMGSPWGRVQDAAVSALRVLSRGGFELQNVDPRNVAQTTAANAEAARTWYLANQRDIPRDGPLDAD